MALSGGVAPGYYLLPLQGTKNLPFGLTPLHPVSDITESRFRLSMLRMVPSASVQRTLERNTRPTTSSQCFALGAYNQVTFGFLPRLNHLSRNPRIERPVACPRLLGSSMADCHL